VVDSGGDFRKHMVEVGEVALMEKTSPGDYFWWRG
jgi:hypothetical protein